MDIFSDFRYNLIILRSDGMMKRFRIRRYLMILCMCLFCSGCFFEIDFTNQESEQIEETAMASIDEDAVYVHFLATGNSDAMLIQGEQTVLIDGGQNDDGMRITAYLKALGISELDYLISTHPDADHCGGLDDIVKHFEIHHTYVGNGDSDTAVYQDFVNALDEKGLTPAVPLKDEKVEIGEDAYLTFYNTDYTGNDSNDASLVTLLEANGWSVLFTGDISSEIERSLQDELPDIDVLKVAHHGSKYSCTSTFIYQLQPEYAVICTGENIYGHPDQGVMDRLERVGAEVLRTDEKGNIVMKLGTSLVIQCNQNYIDLPGTKTNLVITEPEADKPEQSESPQQSSDADTKYVGNRNTMKFHYAECDSVDDMNEKNKVFGDEREYYIENGYVPCKRCTP